MKDSLTQLTTIGTVASTGTMAVSQDPNLINLVLTLVTVVGQIIVLFKKNKNANSQPN